MKKLFLFILLGLFGVTSQAQNTLPIEYKVSVDSTDKTTLFNGYNQWVAKNFNNSNNVVRLNDQVSGIVVIKFILNTKLGTYSTTHCTMEFNVKDNKYRLLFSDIYVESPKTSNSMAFNYTYQDLIDISLGNKFGSKKVASRFLNDVNTEIANISASIEDHLKYKQVVTDW